MAGGNCSAGSGPLAARADSILLPEAAPDADHGGRW